MIREVAITPSVFMASSHDGVRELCDARVGQMRTALLHSLLVRDLCDGEWQKATKSGQSDMPNISKKLFKALKTEKRLRAFAPTNSNAPIPATSEEWCTEAVDSHSQEILSGIVACPDVASAFRNEPLVRSVAQLNGGNWWEKISNPRRSSIGRTKAALESDLGFLLQESSFIQFIDPYLDPTDKDQYGDFPDLLKKCKVGAMVELHRNVKIGTGPNAQILNNSDWESRFQNAYDQAKADRNLKITVVIWPDEHERHLLTNLQCLLVGHGFGTTTNPSARMACTPYPPVAADEKRREFDTAIRAPHHKFVI